MDIPESARAGVRKYLGDEADIFISKVDERLLRYGALWRLNDLSFMPTDTVNFLFSCVSALYGPCVLKMCIPGPETATEIGCLRAYNGRGYVKLWDYSLTDDMMLLEKVKPGDQMWAVKDYRERARLMGERVKDLPIAWDGRGDYPTYRSWMEGIRAKLVGMGGLEEPVGLLDEAYAIYDGLKQTYDRDCLLHGDLHQENMLLNASGGYTVIDPKGVVDDPVMETARFLMNETPCEDRKIFDMVDIMSPIINIPEADILKSMYIDAALSHCWTLEEFYDTPELFTENKRRALETIKFVRGLLGK